MFLATEVWQWILPIGIGLLIGILLASRKNYDYSKIVPLAAKEFQLNMRKGQLLDLRAETAYAVSHINGARNFPKSTLFQNLFKLRKDMAIFLVDDRGANLVKQVSRKLIRKGYRPIYILVGGLEKWPFSLKE